MDFEGGSTTCNKCGSERSRCKDLPDATRRCNEAQARMGEKATAGKMTMDAAGPQVSERKEGRLGLNSAKAEPNPIQTDPHH